MLKTAQSLKDSTDPDKATAGGEEAPPIVDDVGDVIDSDVPDAEEATDDATAGAPETAEKASG